MALHSAVRTLLEQVGTPLRKPRSRCEGPLGHPRIPRTSPQELSQGSLSSQLSPCFFFIMLYKSSLGSLLSLPLSLLPPCRQGAWPWRVPGLKETDSHLRSNMQRTAGGRTSSLANNMGKEAFDNKDLVLSRMLLRSAAKACINRELLTLLSYVGTSAARACLLRLPCAADAAIPVA